MTKRDGLVRFQDLQNANLEAALPRLLTSRVTSLNFCLSRLTHQDIAALGSFLSSSDHLRELYIPYVNMDQEGYDLLGPYLEKARPLQVINASSRSMPQDLRWLERVLINTQSLTTLILHHIPFTIDSVTQLARGVASNRTLTDLDLSLNRLGAESGSVIIDAFCINSTVRSLNLGWNELGPVCAISIARVLAVNTSLISLQLMRNDFYDCGAELIADAFAFNCTLTDLNLSCNRIASPCLQSLMAMFQSTSLRSLNLEHNPFSSPAVSTNILTLIRLNTTLTRLVVHSVYNDYPIQRPFQNSVEELMHRNQYLIFWKGFSLLQRCWLVMKQHALDSLPEVPVELQISLNRWYATIFINVFLTLGRRYFQKKSDFSPIRAS